MAMSDSKVPPRPWRVDRYGGVVHVIGHNEGVGSPGVADCYENSETAEFIVRLVNAEQEIVAALEAAHYALDLDTHTADGMTHARDIVRAALAKVRP